MARRSLLLLSLLWTPSYQSDCSGKPPIVVPITDVVLKDGNAIRGVLTTVGSPPQNLSIIPQVYLNNTWVYNTSATFCPKDRPDTYCNTFRGGLYEPGNSSTSKNAADVHAAGGSPSDTDRAAGVHIWESAWTNDDFGVANVILNEFPIGMAGFSIDTQYHPQGALGLGPNSTLLTALKDAGHISSRSYGYWWGEDGATANAKMDGSLVFGGYDAAKTQGPNTTIALKRPSVGCASGMYLSITDMIMRFPNGTRASITEPFPLLPACLHIDFPAMLAFARKPYYDRFENNAQIFTNENSVGIDWWNPVYDPSYVYQGDLLIVLDSGMELTLPNELLVVPMKMIDDSGAVYENSSVAEILIQPTLNGDAADTPVVGKQFFSSNYLFVDHDAGTFTVWSANRTTDTRLVAVGGNCNATDPQKDPVAPVSTPPTNGLIEATDSAQNDSKADEDSVSLSIGTIAGIAGGAAGALAVIAAILFVCFMRRKKRKLRAERSLLSSGGVHDDQKRYSYHEADSRLARHELHNIATSELDAPREVRELYGDDSKHKYAWHKSQAAPTVAYELAARTP